MNPRYPQVATRAAHRCEYCFVPEMVFNFPFEVEHVVPIQLGGLDDDTNWALACRSCNLYKRDRLEAMDPLSATASRLFHPRRDFWGEHFRLDQDEGMIHGLTPIGRATIEQLRINATVQKAARLQWIRLGLMTT